MRISIYANSNDVRPRDENLSWDELATLLQHVRIASCDPCVIDLSPEEQLAIRKKSCPEKDGWSWSPHFLKPGTTRANGNVLGISALVLEPDGITIAQSLQLADSLAGWQFILHSTHSHRAHVGLRRTGTSLGAQVARESCCYRIVLATDRVILPEEFATVWRWASDRIGLKHSDEQCKDLQRLYYLPSTTATQRSEFVFIRGEGSLLNVSEICSSQRISRSISQAAASQTTHVLDAAVATPQAAVDLEPLRAKLKDRRRRASRGTDDYIILNGILKGQKFCVPGYDDFGGTSEELRAKGLIKGRDGALHKAASILAFSLPVDTPQEVIVELIRNSLAHTDVEPEGYEHWKGEFLDSYSRGLHTRIQSEKERKELDDAVRSALQEISARPKGLISAADSGFSTTTSAIEAVSNPSGSADTQAGSKHAGLLSDWKTYLLRNEKGELKQCGENAFTILALDERLRSTISWDEVEKEIRVSGGPFQGIPSAILDSEVAGWLCRHWELNLASSLVGEIILRVAMNNSIDPLKSYLENLRWDGIDRIDYVLEHYAGAATVSRSGQDITPYVRSVSRKTLIGAVARALQPGVQMDTVLVLEGSQGEGKTSFCRILGGRWAATTTLVLGDKDTQQLVSTAWITELGELRSLRATDTYAMRSFITQTEDRFRPPFRRSPERFPRRCIFVGTVDELSGYLRETDRRIWPVHCRGFNLVQLKADRDQIWAQAVEYYRRFLNIRNSGAADSENEYTWWMPKTERQIALHQLEERIETTVFETKIAEWWGRSKKRPSHVTAQMIAEDVLSISADRVTHSVATEIGLAMRRLGFEKARVLVGGHRAWVYVPTESLLNMPITIGTTSTVADAVARLTNHMGR